MKPLLIRFLLPALLGAFFGEVKAQSPSIAPERKGDSIYFVAPGLHFLSGKPMEKLRNGSSVTYIMALAVFAGNSRKPISVTKEVFVVSYDLWEERFSIIQSRTGGRSISRLTAASAEAWCFENITIPIRTIPERRPFVLRFECSVDEGKEGSDGRDHSPLTLAGLIEVFGRKKSDAPFRMEAEGGPFRLEELKK